MSEEGFLHPRHLGRRPVRRFGVCVSVGVRRPLGRCAWSARAWQSGSSIRWPGPSRPCPPRLLADDHLDELTRSATMGMPGSRLSTYVGFRGLLAFVRAMRRRAMASARRQDGRSNRVRRKPDAASAVVSIGVLDWEPRAAEDESRNFAGMHLEGEIPPETGDFVGIPPESGIQPKSGSPPEAQRNLNSV